MKNEASLCRSTDQLSVEGMYGQRSSGFMELLDRSLFQEYPSCHSSPFFDFPPPPTPVTFAPFSSVSEEEVNLLATPNESSITSSSTNAPIDSDAVKEAATAPDADGDDDFEKEKTEEGGKKKKGQKRKREPRIAFLTKTNVNLLEDGYKWRKYGQKAVKDSPFPRSYYRCTTAMCGVKKLVERSSKDPTIVMTTYEGKHTHQSPAVPRGSHLMDRFAAPLVHIPSGQVQLPFFSSHLPQLMPQPLDLHHVESAEQIFLTAPTGSLSVRDHGCFLT